MALGGATAHADYPPKVPDITTDSSTPTPGEQVTITLSGFCPGDVVTLVIQPGGVTLGTATADANGHATFQFDAPTGVGTYTITARGGQCSQDVASVAIEVASESIPRTGSDSSTSLMLGSIALLLGAGLVGSTALYRRRSAA
jgi:hypothetical protein